MDEKDYKEKRKKFIFCAIIFFLIMGIYICGAIDFNIKLIFMIFLVFLTFYMVVEFKKMGTAFVILYYIAGFVAVSLVSGFSEYHFNAVLAFQISTVISVLYLYTYVAKVDAASEMLYEHTIMDDLTKAYNKRYYKIKVREELARSNRYNQRFSVMLMDFDDFKTINDTYGHVFGDEVLKSFVNELKDKIRGEDTFCRIGGDEFILVISNFTEKCMEFINMRIEETVASINLMYSEEMKGTFSVSVGYAVFPDDTSNLTDLLIYADSAMYKAKEIKSDKTTFVRY